jgi:hypothetical protein
MSLAFNVLRGNADELGRCQEILTPRAFQHASTVNTGKSPTAERAAHRYYLLYSPQRLDSNTAFYWWKNRNIQSLRTQLEPRYLFKSTTSSFTRTCGL